MDDVVHLATKQFESRFSVLNATGTSHVVVSNLNFEQHSEEHIMRTVSKAKVSHNTT